MIDRDLRTAVNRAAHAIGTAESTRARQALQDALQALREAGASRAVLLEYAARCEAAGAVLPIPSVVPDRQPA